MTGKQLDINQLERQIEIVRNSINDKIMNDPDVEITRFYLTKKIYDREKDYVYNYDNEWGGVFYIQPNDRPMIINGQRYYPVVLPKETIIKGTDGNAPNPYQIIGFPVTIRDDGCV